MRNKYLALKVKQSPTDGSGEFTAVVSTFGGQPDADGDVIAPGAYDQTIAEWRAKGEWPTVWYMHGYEDPLNAIGKLTDVRVEGDELVVDGKLDLSNERAVQVYEGMLTDKLNEFSIGYAVRDEVLVKDDSGDPLYFLIKNLELLEVSIVFAGANRNTRLVSIKSLKEMLDAGQYTKARELGAEPSTFTRISWLESEMPAFVIDALEKSIQSEIESPSGNVALSGEKVWFEGKPWHVEARGSQYCVIKDSDGSTVACHDTRAEADAQVRALYASDSGKETLMDEKALEPTPSTEAEMRAHLEAAPPAGHGFPNSEVGPMSMPEMTAFHAADHQEGDAKHTHPGKSQDAEQKWDGAAAMATCQNAGDFRKIAFERNDNSDPNTAAHWALPHHDHPGGPADPGGVAAALGALHGGRGGAPDLKESVATVENHLQAHEASFNKSVEYVVKKIAEALLSITADEAVTEVEQNIIEEIEVKEVEIPDEDVLLDAEIRAKLAELVEGSAG